VIASVEYFGGEPSVDWTSERFGTRAWGLRLGQFDDDPAMEIIIGDGDGVVRSIDGRTKELEWESEAVDRDAHGLLLHDVDGDGRNELLVGTGFKTDQGWGQVYFFRDNSSAPYRELPAPWNSRLRELHIGDLDRDGEEELLVCSGAALGDVPGEGYFRVYDLASLEVEFTSPDLGGCVEGLKVMDLDGDGGQEIILSNGYRYREGHCFIYSYDGSTYERLWKSGNIGPKAYGLDAADIDGDGTFEIVAGNMAGNIFVFDGASMSLEWTSGNLGRDMLGITLFDIDSDGDIEIVAGQGGYNGKGDYTSGYTTPHIYVIDGRTKEVESVIGDMDPTIPWLRIALVLLLVLLVVQMAMISRLLMKMRGVRR